MNWNLFLPPDATFIGTRYIKSAPMFPEKSVRVIEQSEKR